MNVLSFEEFLTRVKGGLSVSRLVFSLGFSWDFEKSRKLVAVVADLSSANLSFADLSSANLRYANLSFADLRSANLSFADLRSANLSSANLSSANLRYANLSSADLRSADLRSANLSFADLRYANLSFADLRSADLRSANLSYADLHYANLSFADLLKTIFTESSFVFSCSLGSFASFLLSLKNASQEQKNYFYVQNLAHTKPKVIMDALDSLPKEKTKLKVKAKKKVV